MRHAVLGAGGVGGLIAAVLARSGRDVVIVARPATVARTPTITVDSVVLGSFEIAVPFVSALDASVDVLWIAIKSTALEEALTMIPAHVIGDAAVVPLLNGLDHVAVLRERYRHVVPGVMRVESERVAPGRIEQRSSFMRMDVSAREDIAAEVTDAGIACRVHDDETTMLWEKLAFLAPLALSTTAFDAPLGVVRDDPLHLACQVETETVAAAEGATIDTVGLEQLRAGAANTMRSSMQNDVAAGRPPELDAIGGAVQRAAARHHIATPATDALIDKIRSRLPAHT